MITLDIVVILLSHDLTHLCKKVNLYHVSTREGSTKIKLYFKSYFISSKNVEYFHFFLS